MESGAFTTIFSLGTCKRITTVDKIFGRFGLSASSNSSIRIVLASEASAIRHGNFSFHTSLDHGRGESNAPH